MDEGDENHNRSHPMSGPSKTPAEILRYQDPLGGMQSGLHAAAAVCTVAMIAAAAITARFLRHVPPTGAGEEAEAESDPAEARAVAGPTRAPAPEPA